MPSGSIHPKTALAGRFATTSLAYNGTPAQPQLTQWGQLGEILGGVRFPERGARRGLVRRPRLRLIDCKDSTDFSSQILLLSRFLLFL